MLVRELVAAALDTRMERPKKITCVGKSIAHGEPPGMKYTSENFDDLLRVLDSLPDDMWVEAEDGTGILETTVAELRARNTWPGDLLVETPPEPDRPGSVLKISRA